MTITTTAARTTTPELFPAWWTCSISRPGYRASTIERRVVPWSSSGTSAIAANDGTTHQAVCRRERI